MDTSQAILKPGDVIGKYRVVRCLGIGGMGEVHLVIHQQLNIYRALKLLRTDQVAADSIFTERFMREARIASRIQHQNIISVIDVENDEASGFFYIVMEYVNGNSLLDVLRDGTLSEDQAIHIISEVAKGLAAASEFGLVHRDIKPSNIMISQEGEVKLADLGIAKASDEDVSVTLTMENSVVGTPAYSAPEQCSDAHDVDVRADIYSLGATLYEMVTGLPPFDGANAFDTIAHVLSDEPIKPRRLNPNISEELENLILKMMAKDRALRPQNIAELQMLLKPFQAARADIPPELKSLIHERVEREVQARTSTVITAYRKKQVGERIIVLSAVIVLLVAVCIFFLYRNSRSQREIRQWKNLAEQHRNEKEELSAQVFSLKNQLDRRKRNHQDDNARMERKIRELTEEINRLKNNSDQPAETPPQSSAAPVKAVAPQHGIQNKVDNLLENELVLKQSKRKLFGNTYSVPFTVRAVCRTDGVAIRFLLLEGEILLKWWSNIYLLNVNVPDSKGNIRFGGENKWSAVEIKVTASEISVYVDGVLRYTGKGDFNNKKTRIGIKTISVGNDQSTVSVKQLSVLTPVSIPPRTGVPQEKDAKTADPSPAGTRTRAVIRAQSPRNLLEQRREVSRKIMRVRQQLSRNPAGRNELKSALDRLDAENVRLLLGQYDVSFEDLSLSCGSFSSDGLTQHLYPVRRGQERWHDILANAGLLLTPVIQYNLKSPGWDTDKIHKYLSACVQYGFKFDRETLMRLPFPVASLPMQNDKGKRNFLDILDFLLSHPNPESILFDTYRPSQPVPRSFLELLVVRTAWVRTAWFADFPVWLERMAEQKKIDLATSNASGSTLLDHIFMAFAQQETMGPAQLRCLQKLEQLGGKYQKLESSDRNLIKAIRDGNPTQVERVIRGERADLKKIYPFCGNALNFASSHNIKYNPAIIWLLLKHDTPVNIQTGLYSPLAAAIEHENRDIVDLLLRRGVRLNDRNALQAACRRGNTAMAEKLLQNGTPPGLSFYTVYKDGQRIRFYGTEFLFAALESKSVRIAELLIQKGVNLKRRGPNGKTPLEIAESDPYLKPVAKLIRKKLAEQSDR